MRCLGRHWPAPVSPTETESASHGIAAVRHCAHARSSCRSVAHRHLIKGHGSERRRECGEDLSWWVIPRSRPTKSRWLRLCSLGCIVSIIRFAYESLYIDNQCNNRIEHLVVWQHRPLPRSNPLAHAKHKLLSVRKRGSSSIRWGFRQALALRFDTDWCR